MRISLTIRELLKYGLWERVCDIKGINVWAIKEGLIDADDTLTFTLAEAQELNLFKLWEAGNG